METSSIMNQPFGAPAGLSIGDSQLNITHAATSDPDLALTTKDPVELGRAIEGLPELERLVLSLHYYEELNFKEIGMVLNLKRSKISRIHNRAIYSLKTNCSHS